MSNADERRLNDFDGRGYLSDRRLSDFCEFVLTTAADQLDFMHELLDLDRMQHRILGFAARGQIARGDVARIIGVSPRTAQTVTGRLLAAGLLVSDSAKGLVRLGFPSIAAASYFPNLFPAGDE